MQLSKLEIKGFKSFAESATIHFDRGVTGIVGPNGCGKSNVVDAIRWVLGEQRTKSLRSDKMENIIFNGTNQRKPSTVAQVSLTFDNTQKILPSDYTYITITRRLYRSGESEYLINDVKCRLKDIQNLFLDTGIGSDSYAIIELKKVDEILNDTDGSRRQLFEKAAGISKYKLRKKESLARLEYVDQDLARVGDLLFEIEKNLKTLEKQAKQAEKYFALKEEYKQSSLAYAQKTIRQQREVYQQLQKQIQAENDKRKQLQQLFENQEVELEKEKKALAEVEQVLYAEQHKLNEHKNRLRQTENEQKLKNERQHYLQEKENNIRIQIDTDIKALQALKVELDNRQNDLSQFETELIKAEAELQTEKADYEAQKQLSAEKQIQLKNIETRHQAQQNALFQLNKEYEIKQTQLSASKQELEKIAQRDHQQMAEISAFEVELAKIEDHLSLAQQELIAFQEKEERRHLEIQDLEEQINEMRQNLALKQRELDSKQNEFDLNKSLIDNMEGFPEAVRYLQKDTAWADNVPLLSDIITCDEKYQLAIENFLEPYLNYYVVNTLQEAYEAIHLLAEAGKGKANFFVLENLDYQGDSNKNTTFETTLKPETSWFFGGLDTSELTHKNQLEPISALSVINFEPEHEALVRQLLGLVYVVDNESLIKSQNDLTRDYVSLEGHIIRRRFSLTGGSVGAFEGNRLGRVKNIERLSLEIKDLQNQIHEQSQSLQFKQANLQSLKQNQSLKEAINQARKQTEKHNHEKIALLSKKEQLSAIVAKSYDRQAEVQDRIGELLDAIDLLLPKTQKAQTELDELRGKMLDLNEELVFENESLAQKSARFNQQNIAFHQQKNRVNALHQEIEYKTNNKQTINQRLEKLENDLIQVENDLEVLLESQENYNDLIRELQSQSPAMEETVRINERDFYRLRGEIAEEEKAIKETQKQKEQQDFLLQQLNQKMHETDLSLASVKERLSVEFQIDLDGLFAIELPTSDLNELELKNLVEDLRQKIERLGTINPLAMEEYQESKTRYDFISTQKADLEQSKKSLLQTIEEMENFARTAFMEAFEKIRQNFVQVFRSLFSEEDKADLILSLPDNPLEADIDIIAQPKGKRPLTIDQLSGGEKTLTAISLLFALYLLKPAPFCIFDEVDAPLDDANTEKFNNIIKEFSKDSQFIIVTHNKRTMAYTDIMYGVTMIQQGISSVVPVDLREFV
jgi:chromosome segregation protein